MQILYLKTRIFEICKYKIILNKIVQKSIIRLEDDTKMTETHRLYFSECYEFII